MKSTRTPPSLCAHCGYKLDAATAIGGKARPKPGDLTLCLRCAGVCLFDETLVPRMPPEGFLDDLRRKEPRFAAEIDRARRLILFQRTMRPMPDRDPKA